jgi:hypothetical protein
MDHPETGVRSESSRPAPGEPASRQVANMELAVSLVPHYFVGSRDWRSVWRYSFLHPMSRMAATMEAGSGMVDG